MEFFIEMPSPHAPFLEGEEFLQPERPAVQTATVRQVAAIRLCIGLAFMRLILALLFQ
ncbi:MAG: hypothetical protein ACK43N_13295 [Pirellulaceae bacterium]